MCTASKLYNDLLEIHFEKHDFSSAKRKKADFKYNLFYLMLDTYDYTKCFEKKDAESDYSRINGDKRRKNRSLVT